MSAPAGAPVLVDIQGAQSVDHRDRGIARYVLELASALQDAHSSDIRQFLLNPDLPPPGRFEALLATGKVARSDACDIPEKGILHVISPYELAVPLSRVWPRFAVSAGLRLVVTVYDVIPEIFSAHYLEDPALRRRYRARHHLVQAADRILAISRTTAADVVEHLGVDPGRVSVVGAAVSESFVRPTSREEAGRAARSAVPGLLEHFVLYTGGMEYRKNVEGLLAAFAALPPPVLADRQLVIACRLTALDRNHLFHRAGALGVQDKLLLPGFVPDGVLRLLYQASELFVFPSLYEGYGLPVAEAMACGAPVLAARTPALAELVGEEALFDPRSTGSMASAMGRALTDAGLRARLVAASERPATTWRDVADATAAAYQEVLACRPPARPRPRLAFVSPLPPQRTGVAGFSYRLLDALRRRPGLEVDAFADSAIMPVQAPEGIDVYDVDAIERTETWRGGYDGVIYSIGNSEFHAGALAALRRRPGVVLAHEARLTGLYALAASRADAVPGGFQSALQSMYPGAIPEDLGHSGWLTSEEADSFGVSMAKEVVALADRVLAMSEIGAELIRLDADPAHADRVAVVPWAVTPGVPGADREPPRSRPPLVATFGIVNQVKQVAKLVEAFTAVLAVHPEARLAVVGPASVEDVRKVSEQAGALGVSERVELTNEVDGDVYRDWLGRATVAVQLRAVSNGESSAAVGDCLAFGTPTIVTAVGPARELPDDAVVKVEPTISPEELAQEILALVADGDRRAGLRRGATAFAATATFDRLAEELCRQVLGTAVAAPAGRRLSF